MSEGSRPVILWRVTTSGTRRNRAVSFMSTAATSSDASRMRNTRFLPSTERIHAETFEKKPDTSISLETSMKDRMSEIASRLTYLADLKRKLGSKMRRRT